MAEFVEQRIQETIPEVEELERIGLLSSKEVKKLILKRRVFEYRLARQTRSKCDIVDYITYEKKLIELIRIRRKQIGLQEKRNLIESAIYRRAVKLSRFLTRAWPYHLDTWDLRINFARFIGWKEEISGTYAEQVRFHGNRESVWVSWAKWEVEARKDFARARLILLSKAPLYHPKSVLIKRELMRLELLYVENLLNKKNNDNIAGLEEVIAENREKVLNCAVAQAVYEDTVNKLPEPETYLQLYQVSHKFPFAHTLRDQIYRDVCAKFPDVECVWKLRAQRIAMGIQGIKTSKIKDDVISELRIKEDSEEENASDDEEERGGRATVPANMRISGLLNAKDSDSDGSDDDSDSEEESEDEGIGNDRREPVRKDADKEEEKESEEEEESDEEEEGESDEEESEESDEENEGGKEKMLGENECNDEIMLVKEDESGVATIKNEENNDKFEFDFLIDCEGEEEIKIKAEAAENADNDDIEVIGMTAGKNDRSVDLEGLGDTDEIKLEPEIKTEGESQVEMESSDDTEGKIETESNIEADSTVETEETEAKAEKKEEPEEIIHDPPLNRSPIQKLKLVISTLDEALRRLGPSFVDTYLDELLPLFYQCWGVKNMSTLVISTVHRLCRHHAPSLTPHHFYLWYLVLKDQGAGSKKLRTILNRAVRCHPDAHLLQLEHIRVILREAQSDAQVLKEFDTMGLTLRGPNGVAAWSELAQRLSDPGVRTRVLQRATTNQDPAIALATRTLYLKQVTDIKGIEKTRAEYKKLSWCPPLSATLHAQMVALELAQEDMKIEAVRRVFQNATQQFGATNPGMWLAYIQFEKQRGDSMKVGGIYKRAETELEAVQAHIFRQLNFNIRGIVSKESTDVEMRSPESEGNQDILIDAPEILDEVDLEEIMSGLVELFAEEPTLTYLGDNARKEFFSALATFKTGIAKGKRRVPKKVEEKGDEWEGVMETLVGQHVPLSFTTLPTNPKNVKQEGGKKEESDKIAPRFTKRYEPTDQLEPGTDQPIAMGPKSILGDVGSHSEEVALALKSSMILKPEFLKKTKVEPLFVTKKKAKELRKREQAKTKGKGWFDMKAPEMTEEVQRDLEVIRMRSVLDPRRHSKTSDMKVTPKHFHLGQVVDSPLDFYSSRVPKKQRKRTLAEEIINDEEALRYQKRKYTEIVAAKQQGRHKWGSKKKVTSGNPRRKEGSRKQF